MGELLVLLWFFAFLAAAAIGEWRKTHARKQGKPEPFSILDYLDGKDLEDPCDW
jgi:hypothetical protein